MQPSFSQWWERGLQPASGSASEKRPDIRCRGGVLKSKRRKRRAPLPTTSGCTACCGCAVYPFDGIPSFCDMGCAKKPAAKYCELLLMNNPQFSISPTGEKF